VVSWLNNASLLSAKLPNEALYHGHCGRTANRAAVLPKFVAAPSTADPPDVMGGSIAHGDCGGAGGGGDGGGNGNGGPGVVYPEMHGSAMVQTVSVRRLVSDISGAGMYVGTRST
jgi:hypothetical protein